MEFVAGKELTEELMLQKSGNLFNSDQPLGASAALGWGARPSAGRWDCGAGEAGALPARSQAGPVTARPRHVQVITGEGEKKREGKGNGPVSPCSLCPAVFQGGDGKENVPEWESS